MAPDVVRQAIDALVREVDNLIASLRFHVVFLFQLILPSSAPKSDGKEVDDYHDVLHGFVPHYEISNSRVGCAESTASTVPLRQILYAQLRIVENAGCPCTNRAWECDFLDSQ